MVFQAFLIKKMVLSSTNAKKKPEPNILYIKRIKKAWMCEPFSEKQGIDRLKDDKTFFSSDDTIL